MKLYILRHGEAYHVGEEKILNDEERFLTPRGEKQARRAGKLLVELEQIPQVVYASPYRRAWETALYAVQEMPGTGEPQQAGWLQPPGSLNELMRKLMEEERERVLIVGHEPFLGEVFQYLLTGISDPPVELSKASLSCIESDKIGGGRAKLRWMLNTLVIRDILKENGKEGS